MKNKLLKSLFNNIGFKLLAVFFACILWLVVYNTDDPTKTKTFSTKVQVENSDAVKKMGKYYEIVEGTGNISFSVSAKRSILDKIADSDFTAVADMNNLVMSEDGTSGQVEIKLTCGRNENALTYTRKPRSLKVSLEDLRTKQFVIAANTTGDVAEGYALGDVKISGSNVLKVTGPASVVEPISSAVAIINVDGVSTNLSDSVLPTLYDEDGGIVDTTKLELSTTKIGIEAAILSTKNLYIVLDYTGTPAEGFEVVSTTASPETIRVKGVSSILNKLTTVNVPSDVLDVEGLDFDLSTTIDISEYLPDGVSLVNNRDGIVAIEAVIEPYEEKDITVFTNRIDVIGLAEGFALAYDRATTEVRVGAVQSVLDTLNYANVLLEINVEGLAEGRHTVPLQPADEAARYDLIEPSVEVTITELPAEAEGEGEDAAGNLVTGDNSHENGGADDNGETGN